MAKEKETLIIQLRPQYERLREYNLPEDLFRRFLLAFAKILVPKWPEDSLCEIINDLIK